VTTAVNNYHGLFLVPITFNWIKQ